MKLLVLLIAVLLSGCMATVRPEARTLMERVPLYAAADFGGSTGSSLTYRVGESAGSHVLTPDWRARFEYEGCRFDVVQSAPDFPHAGEIQQSCRPPVRFQLISPSAFLPDCTDPFTTTQVDLRIGDGGYEAGRGTLFVRWYRCYRGGGLDWPRRSAWRYAAYPIIGLPRDLVDAPFTQLRRWGFGDHISPAGGDRFAPPVLLIPVGAIAVTVLATQAVYQALSPAWLAVVAATGTAIVVLPAAAIVAVNLAFGWRVFYGATVSTPQVLLLRSGIDSEDFFPNWKFVVHDPQAVAGPRQELTEWRILRICDSRADAERDVRVHQWQGVPGFYDERRLPNGVAP